MGGSSQVSVVSLRSDRGTATTPVFHLIHYPILSFILTASPYYLNMLLYSLSPVLFSTAHISYYRIPYLINPSYTTNTSQKVYTQSSYFRLSQPFLNLYCTGNFLPCSKQFSPYFLHKPFLSITPKYANSLATSKVPLSIITLHFFKQPLLYLYQYSTQLAVPNHHKKALPNILDMSLFSETRTALFIKCAMLSSIVGRPTLLLNLAS